MPSPDRGSIWIVDLGAAAKIRPCLILSVSAVPPERHLVTMIPHTRSVRGTQYEVAIQSRFVDSKGAFDAQQIVTVPHVKLIKRLGNLQPTQLTLVEDAVRRWLGI